MPLPIELANGLYINGLGGLQAVPRTSPGGNAHSQITGINVTRHEAWYNCFFQAGPGVRRPAYQISWADPRNFLFVKDIQNGVAIGILPRRAIQTHVYSDNYGGCEWHILARANGESAAFLHVYRGGGALAQYNLAGGWTLRGVLQSSLVMGHRGPGGSICSYAFVPAASNTAYCCFLVLNQQGMVTGVYQQANINIG